jgi:RNA polymerase sigma-70 factor (ECF subfamily)
MSYELPTAGRVSSVSSSPRPSPRAAVVARDAASLRAGLVALVPELRARALRLSGNRAVAEDLAQDTIERALRFADQYERGTNLRAWVHQILFSVFVTRYRRSRRDRNALRTLASDPCAWTLPTPFAAPDGDVALTKTTRAHLDALPKGYRVVIELVDLEQQSYREAAERLGVPVGTVMSRLHRGRRMLADELTRPMPQAA